MAKNSTTLKNIIKSLVTKQRNKDQSYSTNLNLLNNRNVQFQEKSKTSAKKMYWEVYNSS
jgi:hypothetical protein